MQDRKEQAKVEVATLVDKFHGERRRDQSEADVRAGYIDQLFFALGWNIHNDSGKQTNYWREGYIRGAGFVDVGMEIAGQPVLFLEAKRFTLIPESSKRTGDRTPEEKQAFRYTRGRKIPYAILTNFERLHLFNADHERLIAAFDSPDEYLERFEELWRLTPEEVSGGSLGWWEGQLAKKDVDLEFLKSLRAWRLTLADAIFEHNAHTPELQKNGTFDFDKLMEAVQRILDRLILMRYGDDKEVLLAHDLLENTLDEYKKRGAYASKDSLMRAFVDLSHMMDEHHNTTLFAPDHLCEKVVISNEVLANVLEELSRISFRKFTSDILGNTYESYLGTKLKLVNGQIQDEERTDIRKGQGIYYTPSWVVEYIVDKTLGERLRELEKEHGLHAIEKVRGLAVLDPACGSGSFLIKAYHVLADFYRRMNLGIVQEQTKLAEGFASADMFERLHRLSHLPQQVLDYPQVILQEHLYGVDLDPEAAEIATVNLTMQAFADSRQKKLPKILNENIKVGNSLISGTEEELRPYFDDGWAEKRPFNWREQFPVVMQRGGFDIIIGNPPYGAKFSEKEKQYLKTHFAVKAGKPESYLFFMERATSLLRQGGIMSVIVPNAWLTNFYGKQIRNYLLKQVHVLHLVDLEPAKVFSKAVVDNVIFVAQQENAEQTAYPVVSVERVDKTGQILPFFVVAQEAWGKDPETIFNIVSLPHASDLMSKMSHRSIPLRTITEYSQGIIPYKTSEEGKENAYISSQQLGPEWRPLLDAAQCVDRYSLNWNGLYIKWGKWLWCPRTPQVFDNPKILFHRIRKKLPLQLVGTYDGNQFYNRHALSNLVLKPEAPYSIKYVLGVFNSRLANYWFINRFGPLMEVGGFKIGHLPIPRIDFSDASDKALHDRLVALVERILALQERLGPLRGTGLKEEHDLLREVERVDSDIDNLVYDLYGLTEAERRLVEGRPTTAYMRSNS